MRTRTIERPNYVGLAGKIWNYSIYTGWQPTPITQGGVLTRFQKETMIDEGGPRVRPDAERTVTHKRTLVEGGLNGGATYRQNSQQYIEGPACLVFGSVPSSDNLDWLLGSKPSLSNAVEDSLKREDPLRAVSATLPFIGEFHQCIEMVRNPFSFLSTLPVPKGWGRRPLGNVLHKMGFGPASNLWLQKSYGWQPLLGDLTSFGYLFLEAGRLYDEYRRSSNRFRKVRSPILRSETEDSVFAFNELKVRSTTSKAWATYKLRYVPSDTFSVLSFPEFLSYKLGLRPADLFGMAWELTPWSFVADWFLPIGEMLSSIRSTPVRPVIDGLSLHRHTTYNLEHSLGWSGYLGTGPRTEPPSRWYVAKQELYERNTPGIISGSDVSSCLTTPRIINALSLIAQQLMFPVGGPKKG